jgi:hypothetical protein
MIGRAADQAPESPHVSDERALWQVLEPFPIVTYFAPDCRRARRIPAAEPGRSDLAAGPFAARRRRHGERNVSER